jgi:hypothetical protein
MMWLLGLLATLAIVATVDGLTIGWDGGGIPVSASGITFAGLVYTLGIAYGYAGTRALDGRSWSPLAGSKAVLILLGIGAVVATTWTALRERTIATVPPAAF